MPGADDSSQLEERLTRVLGLRSSVRAAWLFRSVADGSAGALSDVDVAVMGFASASFDERAALAVDLAREVHRQCDVVVVEHASPVLAMEIVRSERRFYCRDADAADAWEEAAPPSLPRNSRPPTHRLRAHAP